MWLVKRSPRRSTIARANSPMLLAFEVAAADRSLAAEERNLLELRQHLEIDRLLAAAIERTTFIRHAIV